MSNIISDCCQLWSNSTNVLTNENRQMNTNEKSIIDYLMNMARIMMAISFLFCLYFLLVCVFTHQQQGAEKHHTPESIQSIQALKLEDETLPTDLNINADKNNLTQPEEMIGNIRQPKSIKLSRLMSNYHSRYNKILNEQELDKQPKKRYSVSDYTDNSIKKDEAFSDCGYHLAFTLIERDNNEHLYATKLMNKFSNTLTSILVNINSTNLDPGALCIQLITDDIIRPHLKNTIERIHEELAQITLNRLANMPNLRHHQSTIDIEQHRPLTRYFFIDSTIIEKQLGYILPTLRTYFTHTINSYYSNALFFYSLVLHQVIPSSVANRLILLDVDVQLDNNILLLFEEFGRFKPEEAIGIAYEQQPVYRHILHEYRRDNVNTTFGSPPPNGFPGFNSGVLLLHLRKLRESKLFNSLLNPTIISHVCKKYRFHGHLGDQDFYTVMANEYRSLFHVLPCGWNRQLCQWWRFHGYGDVFDDYHRCDTKLMLYHGNCNSALPTITFADYRRR